MPKDDAASRPADSGQVSTAKGSVLQEKEHAADKATAAAIGAANAGAAAQVSTAKGIVLQEKEHAADKATAASIGAGNAAAAAQVSKAEGTAAQKTEDAAIKSNAAANGAGNPAAVAQKKEDAAIRSNAAATVAGNPGAVAKVNTGKGTAAQKKEDAAIKSNAAAAVAGNPAAAAQVITAKNTGASKRENAAQSFTATGSGINLPADGAQKSRASWKEPGVQAAVAVVFKDNGACSQARPTAINAARAGAIRIQGTVNTAATGSGGEADSKQQHDAAQGRTATAAHLYDTNSATPTNTPRLGDARIQGNAAQVNAADAAQTRKPTATDSRPQGIPKLVHPQQKQQQQQPTSQPGTPRSPAAAGIMPAIGTGAFFGPQNSCAAVKSPAPAAAAPGTAAWPETIPVCSSMTACDRAQPLQEAPDTPHGRPPPPPPKRTISSSDGGLPGNDESPAAPSDAAGDLPTLIALPSESSLLRFSNCASSHASVACDGGTAGRSCDAAEPAAVPSGPSPGNTQRPDPAAGITAQDVHCPPGNCPGQGIAVDVPAATVGVPACDPAASEAVAADANGGSFAAPPQAATRLARKSSHGSTKRQQRAPAHPAQYLVEIGLASLAESMQRQQQQRLAVAALPYHLAPIRTKVQAAAADATLAKDGKPNNNVADMMAGSGGNDVREPAASAHEGSQDSPLPSSRFPVQAAELPKLYTPRSMATEHPLRSLFGDAELKVYLKHLRADVRGPEANPII
eukprot:gene13084-13211_t